MRAAGPHAGSRCGPRALDVGPAHHNENVSVLASALTVRRLIDEHAALRMLRADTLAIMAATLGAHLGSPGARLPSVELHELLDGDLEQLRGHFPISAKNGKAYCDDWRASGILIRRPAGASRGETYELSAAAFDALRIIDQMDAPRTTVTESRLVGLATTLRQLAVDTDPDAARRLAVLEAERDRLDTEIQRLRGGGELTTLDARGARERVIEILMLAQDLPADFARVRARFEEINHDLRSSILATDDAQSTVLDDVFRGVDLIEQSAEGSTFAAFSALLRDPERYAAFDADIAAVLDRDFARSLSVETRRALRSLVREMKTGSRDVHGILTEFARGLRRYVHSQEFQRDRMLRTLLQEALAAAVPARREVKPYADVDLELEISAMRLFSVGEIIPHDPAEFDSGDALEDADHSTIDFAELARIARESEIDFSELVLSVNSTVEAVGPTSIAEVLARHPATQGLASIVGLLSLAAAQGTVDERQSEVLTWHGPRGSVSRAEVPLHLFTGKVEG